MPVSLFRTSVWHTRWTGARVRAAACIALWGSRYQNLRSVAIELYSKYWHQQRWFLNSVQCFAPHFGQLMRLRRYFCPSSFYIWQYIQNSKITISFWCYLLTEFNKFLFYNLQTMSKWLQHLSMVYWKGSNHSLGWEQLLESQSQQLQTIFSTTIWILMSRQKNK